MLNSLRFPNTGSGQWLCIIIIIHIAIIHIIILKKVHCNCYRCMKNLLAAVLMKR